VSADSAAALIAALSGIVVALLAWAERNRTQRRTDKEIEAKEAFASWKALAEEYRAKLTQQEAQYQDLLTRYAMQQEQITDARVKLARYEITESEHLKRIDEVTRELAVLRRRIDGRQ
jgi:chromosome segregation ATPase